MLGIKLNLQAVLKLIRGYLACLFARDNEKPLSYLGTLKAATNGW